MVAYFDLDKTLLDVSSGSAWLKAEMAAGNLRWWDLMIGFVWLTLYHVFGLHVGDPMRMAVRKLAGRPYSEIVETAESVYSDSVKGRARTGALDALAYHRAQGHRVYLLSSSLDLIVAKVAQEYGFDGYLATELHVDQEMLLTGEIKEPLCFGAGKVLRAAEHVRELGLTLEDSVFYSDSVSDLPMLSAAGRGVAVNPDFRLRRGAKRLGMCIEDWGCAGSERS